MFRFLSVSAPIVGFSLLCSATLFAEQVIDVGSTFKCYFQDENDTQYSSTSDTTWTTEQINAVSRALTTWDNLIQNTPGRTLTVGLYWKDQGYGTLASASSPGQYSLTNGLQECSTVAESVWRDGDAKAGYTTSFDIMIFCNSWQSGFFYYGADPINAIDYPSQYDFQTVLTHEIGHALGFISYATKDGTFQTYSDGTSYSTTIYSAFDKLMTNAEGEQIINQANGGAQVFNLGETLTLGDTGLTVYNPSSWQEGSSMSHIDAYSEQDAVMQYSIPTATNRRTLTDAEIALMSAMGWNMIPEPSSTTLSLLGFFSLLWRRKRYSSK